MVLSVVYRNAIRNTDMTTPYETHTTDFVEKVLFEQFNVKFSCRCIGHKEFTLKGAGLEVSDTDPVFCADAIRNLISAR
jgi:hypothetical protein